jgi:hypothetical protein
MKQYDKANQPAPASSLLPLLISMQRDDGAASPTVLANFLRATWVLVSGDLAQLNAGPIIVHD